MLDRIQQAQLPYTQDLSPLLREFTLRGKTIANRILYQPMEGCDGTHNGSPGELTRRRYQRFAQGGPGVIWAEATAVVEEGRANPRQLWLHENNLDDFAAMAEEMKSLCFKTHGFEPLVLLQLTHSGRYSRPHGPPAPRIAYNSPVFEGDAPLPQDCIVSDDELFHLEEQFGQAARLAELAGFDGVDIKACHRYLLSELLSAHTRPGHYGGSFENRTRMLLNCAKAARAATSFIITTRMNAYDGFVWPYGFGVNPGEDIAPDYKQALALVKLLSESCGMELINITIGNPYVNPHVNRPADTQQNKAIEPPMEGVARILNSAVVVQKAFPQLAIVSSGLSYLREHSANVAAAMLEQGQCAFAGFGRLSFAYPNLAQDIVLGTPSPKQYCIACTKCSQLMRMGSTAGCVVRDELYRHIYSEAVKSSG